MSESQFEKIIEKAVSAGVLQALETYGKLPPISYSKAVKMFGYANVNRWKQELKPIHTGRAVNSKIEFSMAELSLLQAKEFYQNL